MPPGSPVSEDSPPAATSRSARVNQTALGFQQPLLQAGEPQLATRAGSASRHHRGALWLRIHFNLCFRRIFLTFLMTRGLSQTPRSSLYGLDIILLIEQSAGGGAFNACCE